MRTAPLRVLTMVQDLRLGGNQRVAQNFSLIYRSLGCEVAVLAVHGGGPREPILEQAGVELFIGDGAKRGILSAADSAVKWIPDLVHLHKAGIREKWLIDHLRSELSDVVPFMEKESFSRPPSYADRIDLFVHQAKWAAWKFEMMCRLEGYRHGLPSVILPNPTDTHAFYPATSDEVSAFRAEYGIPVNHTLFGRIGQPLSGKWSTKLLTAFQRFLKAERADAHLMVVGAPDGIIERIHSLPPEIRRHVTSVDRMSTDEELRVAYSAMDAFILAANQGESFGMVLVEAMACGTPCIALATPFRDNSQAEVVVHERTGYVVNGVSSMARAMRTLHRDEDLVAAMGDNARLRAAEEYSFEAVGSRLSRVVSAVSSMTARRDFVNDMRNDPEIRAPATLQVPLNLVFRSSGSLGRIRSAILAIPGLHLLILRLRRILSRARKRIRSRANAQSRVQTPE